jgi:hypothetical protein
MRSNLFEQLIVLSEKIRRHGPLPPDRMAMVKSWLNTAARRKAFVVWIAGRAVGKKGKTKGTAGELLTDAAALLCGRYATEKVYPELDSPLVQGLLERLAALRQNPGPGAMPNRYLRIVEDALTLYLRPEFDPASAYQLALDYCCHEDRKRGRVLHGPSETRILDLARFTASVEGLEEFYGADPNTG